MISLLDLTRPYILFFIFNYNGKNWTEQIDHNSDRDKDR